MEAQVQKIASAYLDSVRPTGEDSLRATCPFCESSRAFVISTRSGLWLCYSCGARGALPTFLKLLGMTRQQIDRMTADLRLPPPLTQRQKQKKALKEGWSVLPEYILGAYDHTPQELVDIGFDAELLRAHDVGVDEKHNRITFAIRDIMDRLVAISGRARTDATFPRYKVYDAEPPNLPPKPPPHRAAGEFYGIVDNYVPDNRKHLYGFHTVYPMRYFEPTQAHSPLIITEGYKSTLWMRQMGFPDTVGLQGSSLTSAQLRLLGRIRGPFYILLDNESGKAFPDRKRSCAAVDIARALQRSGRAFICLYDERRPIGTAPDDINDKEELQAMVQGAKTLGQLYTQATT